MNRLDLLSHRDQHHDYRQNAEKFHGFPQILDLVILESQILVVVSGEFQFQNS